MVPYILICDISVSLRLSYIMYFMEVGNIFYPFSQKENYGETWIIQYEA